MGGLNSLRKLSRGDPRCSPEGYYVSSVLSNVVWTYGGGGYDIHVAIGKDRTYLRSEDGGCQNHKRDCAVTSHLKYLLIGVVSIKT